jgi:hypothetical protein
VIRHNLKKSKKNEQLKNRKRDLLLRLKHLAELEITKEDVNE